MSQLFTSGGQSVGVSASTTVLPMNTEAAAAAAAKPCQSCPTLCDRIDSSPPGSPFPGILQQECWSGLPFPSPMRESEVSQSCLTLSDPMDCSLPGSSIHGSFQARLLEWVAIAFSVGRLRAEKLMFLNCGAGEDT